MIKVVVDTLGGDHGIKAVVEGSIKALRENQDLSIILVGPTYKINEELTNYSLDEFKNRIEIINATEEITCHDKPTEAIKKKKDSSMVKSFDILKENDDVNAFVTVGSTGAVLTGAVLKIGRIKGVKRPAFCPILPTVNNKIVAICDSGANAECDEFYLQQFAIMGSLYLEKTFGIKKPKVALLNIGTEEEKGDTLRKEAYKLLSKSPINFVGNMESRDLLSGNYDLVVCDGFSGNVLLKSTEGTAIEILKLLKENLSHGFFTLIGALLIKGKVKKIKNMMDYNNYGGAVMLGVSKTIIKAHGSSKASSIYHCLIQAYNIEKNSLRKAISEGIENIAKENDIN